MNGFFNNNFLIGFLLAKDLPRNEALTVGLASGMFPQNNMVGPLLLKPQIDTRIDLETKNASLQSSLNNIQSELNKTKGELASLQTKLDTASKEIENRKLPFGVKLPDPGDEGYAVELSVPTATKIENWKIKEVPAPQDISLSAFGVLTIGVKATGTATISVDVDEFTREIVVTVA